MGELVTLFVSQSDLDRAWRAYDDAQLDAVRLYRDPTATAAQRRQAVERSLELHRQFAELSCARVRA